MQLFNKKKLKYDIKKPKMSEKKKKIIIFSSIAVAICLFLVALIAFDKLFGSKDINPSDEAIETYTIPESEKIFVNGVVSPKQTKDYSVPSDYVISSVSVKEGQAVKKGALLFTSKNDAVLEQVKILNTQLQSLKKQKTATKNTPENKEILATLTKQISDTNSQITTLNAKAYIKTIADFDGKIYLSNSTDQDTNKEISSYLTLESTSLYMVGQISEQDLPKLKVDQTATLHVFSTDTDLTGRISSISDRPSAEVSSDANSQNSLSYYDVSIQFDSQEGLVNGYHLQASIKIDNPQIKIPSSCVMLDSDNRNYVFINFDGIMKKQFVEVVTQNDDFAVIREGLKEKDILIKNPTDDMREGDVIENTIEDVNTNPQTNDENNNSNEINGGSTDENPDSNNEQTTNSVG
ncbi:MAG: efflux RND transporter periplasmic adaptor subunit [Clostridioides sp.]|jgi:HlyD family secretion protein|nr:efflux RND transporter periplasmic adaptor subunit [Clostridioides sp.]